MNKTKAPTSLPLLPDTLALRIQHLRIQRQLTPAQLAQKSLLTLEFVEEVEAGIQLFLTPIERQRLARILKVSSKTLLAVEKLPAPLKNDEDTEASESSQSFELLLYRIMQKPDLQYDCPQCKSALVIKQFDRQDMNGDPITALKIHCTQCLFRLSRD